MTAIELGCRGAVVGLSLHLAGEAERALELYELALGQRDAESGDRGRMWAHALTSLLYAYTGRLEEARESAKMARELLDARREAEAQRKEVAVGLVKKRELEAEVGVREEAARASRESEDWLRVRNAELQAALDEAQRERARLQVEAAERPLRLVPHTPYTPGVERKKMVAGAFSTPVIDAMVQASMERSGMRLE